MYSILHLIHFINTALKNSIMNNILNMIHIQDLLNLPEKQLYFLEILKKIPTIVICTL